MDTKLAKITVFALICLSVNWLNYPKHDYTIILDSQEMHLLAL
ncbi:hypothetical protein FDUTEX481_00337 [Tolypothrix sp. PCC 7601]|nr:hypothetical protein FDUTEX481_00337 [Tolypothrix sp. PCC 7601]